MTSGRTVSLPDFKFGIQLYGLQDVFRKDMRGTLQALAGFGYQGIELIPLYDMAAEPLAATLRALKLEAVGFYAFRPLELLDPNHATYAQLRTLGIHHVSAGFPQRVNQDWPAAIEEIRRLADVIRRQGLTLDYHNHEQELQCVQGRPALELLAQQTDKKLVQFELDTYMTAKAGADPVQWIKRLAGSMSRLHVKDIKRHDDAVAVFGKGDLNARAILQAAAHSGVEWLIVEFHPGLANPLEMARLCLQGVRKILEKLRY
ncbi:MAG: sugar phosphate isomerase/epimerase [Kiritimatiellae bacterium]|nr:sugar phosphate isomerase/epimerase [Kiritimatiellia bacterium]